MKISYQWLLELTGLDWPVEEVADRLTLSGTSCEDIESTSRYMDRVVVGEVLDLQPIEGASKIRLATVNLGSETLDLVCGAPNVAVGQKVAVAKLGAKLAGDMEIKKVKIRGVESVGMICSERELGISDDHSGILVLDKGAKIGTPVAEALDFNDYILDFELTPDRADSTSAIGIARDLAVLGGVKLKMPTCDIHEASEPASKHIKVSIDDPVGCPRYAARVIRNIKIGPSPWWIKKKLITAGVRPISNVVDIGNLIMLETGNPLHAFDLKLFGSNEVLVRKAREGEMFTTLDGVEHKLTPEVLLITNGKEAVAAGGVMGGLDSEVKDDTSTVLLEAAYFDPMVVRKSRKRLDLVTEASTRFEKGADPNGVEFAMNRASYLFQELCGGEVLAGIVDCYPEPIKPRTVTMRPERCDKILGRSVPVKRMKEILSGLEFEVSGDNPISAVIPTFRHDIEQEIDLIEEVGRVEGYACIEDSTENKGPLFAPINEIDRYSREIRHVMTGAGFDEIMGHGLAHSRLAEAVNPGAPQLRIVNPVSEDLDIVRNSLAVTVLEAIGHNIAHRNLNLRLFELGKAYFPPDAEGNWIEEERLLACVTGATEANWREKPRPYDFYDLTGALQQLARHFRWDEFEFEQCECATMSPDVSFTLKVGGQELGVIGRVSDEIARKFDVKQGVFLAELWLSALINVSRPVAVFRPLPVYPAAPRDLALIVDEHTRVGDIVSKVKEVAGELAESVEVFDQYTGKQIDSGKKSVGISVIYRSGERSLSSEEVDKLQQDVIADLKRGFNAEVRDR